MPKIKDALKILDRLTDDTPEIRELDGLEEKCVASVDGRGQAG